MRHAILLVALLAAAGCQSAPHENPSLRITKAEAKAAIEEMEANPLPLERPLVIVSGYLDPALGAWWLGEHYEKLIDDDRIITVGYASAGDMETARQMLIEAVDEAFPNDDADVTTTVDVIGISMGGLLARYAALPSRDDPEGRRLAIARLFTLSSPHRGARQAEMPTPHTLLVEARSGSDFITYVNVAGFRRPYELFAYVCLGDDVVGTENAAPEGEAPYWLANPTFQHPHIGGTLDARFMADIARRLRGEEPFSTPPPTPLPPPPPDLPRRDRNAPPLGGSPTRVGR